jgi:hypothetical protein
VSAGFYSITNPSSSLVYTFLMIGRSKMQACKN